MASLPTRAVRSRIKRGTLWAVRRNGRVQVVLRDTPAREVAAREVAAREVAAQEVAGQEVAGQEVVRARLAGQEAPTHHGNGAEPAKDAAATRLRAEIARQKHRVRELERERDRLDRELTHQRRFVDLEHALRARLQDQLDRLNERLSDALPETLDDPAERVDRLWKRLGRQVERLGTGPDRRDD
ncbi:MAG: hypothetical protein ACTSQ7_09945 [Alphaproteobacteria bacterium]